MKYKKYIILLSAISALIIISYAISTKYVVTDNKPNTANPIKKDLIKVNTPLINQVITSPLIIQGEAKGTWFFEGDFPIILKDQGGVIIATGYATAKGQWMTDNFVKFKSTIEFKKPTSTKKGTLILRKDNPSGLTQNNDSLEIPILFK